MPGKRDLTLFKIRYLFGCIFIIVLFCNNALAQPDTLKNANNTNSVSTLNLAKPDTTKHAVKQIDLYDVVSYIFGLHLHNRIDTGYVRPGKLLFAFVPAIGYTLEAGLEGSLTVNASFYTADSRHTNISVLYTLVQYSIHNQLTIPIMSRIWLKDNKYQLIGDWRFFSYPSKTYGIGGNTSLGTYDNINYYHVQVHQQILRHFKSYYYFGGGVFYDNYWNIRDYDNLTDYPLYNGTSTRDVSSGLVVTAKYDNRKNSNNPKQGLFASILYRYNSTLLGSDNNWQYVEAELRKYFRLRPNMVLAFWSLNRFAFGGYVPYLDLPSNGFGTEHYTSRGYIQGRFRGNDMIYQEGELRFGILKNGLVGGVIFANATSVTNWPTENITNIFPGEGAGLRFKFNKFSDVNICVDYAFGVGGSRGFFFNLGEVF